MSIMPKRRSLRFILQFLAVMAACFIVIIIDVLPLPVLIIVLIVAVVLTITTYLNGPAH